LPHAITLQQGVGRGLLSLTVLVINDLSVFRCTVTMVGIKR